MVDICSFRFNNALKVAVASVVATFLYMTLHIPMGMFSVICIYILLTQYYDESLYRGVQRLCGAAIFAALGLLTVRYFYELPAIFYLVFVGVLLLAFYRFSVDRTPYAMLLGGITYAFVCYTGITSPHQVVPLAVGWVVGTGLGLILCWIMEWLWPLRRPSALHHAMAELIERSNRLLAEPHKLQQALQRFQTLQARVQQVKVQLQAVYGHDAESQYLQFIVLQKRMFRLIAGLNASHRQLQIDDAILAALLKRVPIEIHSAIASMVTDLRAHQSRDCVGYGVQRVLEAIDVRMAQLRRQRALRSQGDQHLMALFAMIDGARQTANLVVRIRHFMQRYMNTNVALHKVPSMPLKERAAAKPFSVRAMKNSIKLTLVVIVILIASLNFGLPNAVQAMISGIVICAAGNLGKAHLKFSLRFAGVVIGGVLALLGLVLLSHVTHFWLLLLYVFVVMGVASYVALGNERVAYAGLQAGVMIPLILLYNIGPTTDMTLAYERFLGVIEGACIAGLVLHFIWPQHPLRLLRQRIVSSLQCCTSFYAALLHNDLNALKKASKQIEADYGQLIVDAQYILLSNSDKHHSYEILIEEINTFALVSANIRVSLHALGEVGAKVWLRAFAADVARQQDVLELLQKGFMQVDCVQLQQAATTLSRLKRKVRLLRRRRLTRNLSTAQMAATLACLRDLLRLAESIEKIAACAHHLQRQQSKKQLQQEAHA